MPAQINDFPGYDECEKIDAWAVDAYFDLSLDVENPTGIILDTSWGELKLNLASIVKAGETITHLELLTDTTPQVIRYTNEAGDYECITGDDLSRIISLQLLKDVDQTTPPSDGTVYQYNEETKLFEPFDLKSALENLSTTFNRFEARLTNLQNQINALGDRISVLEQKLTPPDNTPSDARVTFGNINIYNDHTNSDSHQHGVFAHDPTVDVEDDGYFS